MLQIVTCCGTGSYVSTFDRVGIPRFEAIVLLMKSPLRARIFVFSVPSVARCKSQTHVFHWSHLSLGFHHILEAK